MAHAEVVRAVEHTAISVATTVDHVAVAFSSSNKHARTVEVLCNKSFGSLRTEVAEEHYESVASSFFHFCHCLEHIFLILDSCLTVKEFAFVGFHDVLTTLC